NVFRFEGVADSAATEGRTHLVAGWDIIRPLDGRVLVRGSTETLDGPWRVSDYSELVTGLDAALARLARDISSCLSRFPNDSTPPARCDSVAEEQR
ncbi:MAG: membrane integrity-associated transporter subunit PqiC, partial [Cytophagaceae bacterium]|nr:membrane integrity-associated transporter subunit PqiC [Gemmatimonadaceae bacterium]